MQPDSANRRRPRSRRLTLEALEPRAMCALAPAHAVIPAGNVMGSTLRPDGSVEVYGFDQVPFPVHVIIGDGDNSSTDETLDEESNGPKQWLIGADGRLLTKTSLEAPFASAKRTVHAVSPDGTWFVGLKHSTGTSDQGSIVVWKRGTDELVPVGVTNDQTSLPMVRGISNDGDVIYMAYVGEDLRGFAWDRTEGLLPLKSVYAAEGNPSPDAAKFSITAISADGRTIVGSSGGGFTVRQVPTVWRDGIPTALPVTSERGEITDTSATSVSDDGRVIGGYVHLNTPSLSTTQAAVWVDGNLTLLDHSFGPAIVVGGIGGDPTAWAAVGTNWIARSDGNTRELHPYLQAEFGLSLNVFTTSVELLVSEDALYIVTTEMPSGVCVGFNCFTSGKIAAHVLVLPHDYSHSETAALDLSGDGLISPVDALIVINALNAHPGASLFDLPALRLAIPKIDTDGNGELSANDALLIINFVNESSTATLDTQAAESAEPEGEPDTFGFAAAADEYFFELSQPKRKSNR